MELSIEQALHQGVAAHNSGNLQEAKLIYQAILQSDPKHPDANHNLGLIAISVDQIALALPLFKTALDGNPSIERFWISYIDALVKDNQLKGAKQAIRKAKKKGFNVKKLGALVAKSKVKADTKEPSKDQLSGLLHHYQNGRYHDAEKLARALCIQFPSHNFSWKILGAVLKETDRLSEALLTGKKTIEIAPDDAEAHFNFGNTLKELDRLEQAAASYTEAIVLKSDFVEALSNLGNVLKELGRLDESEQSLRQAIAVKADYAEAHNNLGNTLAELGRLELAEASYKQAIVLKSDFVEAHNNLGNICRKLGKLEQSEASLRQATVLKDDYFEAHSNLGVTLKELGRLEESEASLRQALAVKPDHAEVHSNLGITLKELGRYDEAETNLRQAIVLKPDFAEAQNNLGNTLQELGRLDEAEASYKRAIALQPDYAEAHHSLSFTLVKSGKLKEGLDEYEWRWKLAKNVSKNRIFPQPLWDGSQSLKGKRILLWCEQGIGDTINWSSCLSLVAAQAEHTVVECQEKLIPLLARSFPNVEIKPENRSSDSQRDDFDFHLPMGSLYRHFIQKIGQNPNVDAYLVPDPVRVNFWRERLNSLGKAPFIGVSWKSSVVNPFRQKHYPPISEWYSVLSISDVTFINLQYVDFADDLTKIQNDIGVKVHNFDDLDQYNDVDDVTALCAALDMVVSTKVTPLIFSSGVGTSTKIANWRQSVWNNVITNPVSSFVDMFERNTWEPWDNVFQLIAEDIFKLKNKTLHSNGEL